MTSGDVLILRGSGRGTFVCGAWLDTVVTLLAYTNPCPHLEEATEKSYVSSYRIIRTKCQIMQATFSAKYTDLHSKMR